jgi:uncharacterized protein YjdB
VLGGSRGVSSRSLRAVVAALVMLIAALAVVEPLTSKPAGTVTPAILLSISVTPATASVAAGDTQQFTATGLYSNLSTQNLTASVTWSSSLTSAATVSRGGLATGVSDGVTTITATSGLISGTAALTVTPAVLVSISLTPAVASVAAGDTQQFTATGLYSDLSTQNLTSSVTWSSSITSAATVSSGGLATGVSDGVTTITATSGLISSTAALTVLPAELVSISVTPAVASIAAGDTQQYTATGLYSDLSTQNLTSSVTWSSSITSAATVSSGGLATGVSDGVTTITATSGLISGTAALTVLAGVLISISVTPSTASVPLGGTQQFTATGLYSNLSTQDITSSVTWSSSLTSVATVSSGGLATGVSDGATTITATSGLISGTATLMVVPPLTITPSSGTPGTAAVVNGIGFPPGVKIRVKYENGRKRVGLCSVKVAANGMFECNVKIPKGKRAGTTGQHTILAKGRHYSATTTFTLTS